MPRSRKNGESAEKVRKGKKEPTSIEPLHPQTFSEPPAQREEHLRAILHNLSDLIWEMDTNCIFTWCSGAVENIFGVPARELIGKRLFDFMPAEEAQRIKNIIEEILLKKEILKDLEAYNEEKKGRRRWLSLNGIPILDNKGTLKGYIGVCKDITSQKKTEESLRESELKFRTLVDESFDGIVIHDGQRIIGVNKASSKQWGYSPEEAAGSRMDKYFAPECWEEVKEKIQSGYDKPYKAVAIRKNGTRFRVGIAGKTITYKGGTMRVVTTRDIIEREQLEDALRESENKFKTLADEAFDSIVIHDGQRIIEVNNAFGRLWGYDPKEAAGLKIYEFFAPECWEDIKKKVQSGYDRPYETVAIRKDGARFTVEIAGHPIIYKGKPARIASTRDITERKRTEESLRVAEERFSKAFRASPDAMTISRMADGVIFEVNDMWEKTFGYSRAESVGTSSVALGIWCDQAIRQKAVQQLQETSSMYNLETDLRRKTGEIRQVSFSCERLKIGGEQCLLSIIRDITERKRAEEKLKESEDKFRHVFDYSVIGKSITFPLSGEMQVNKAFCEMLGYSKEEMKVKKWQEITHPDDIKDSQKAVDSILSGQKDSVQFFKRYVHKNGSVVWADVSTSLRRDNEGKPLYLMTSVINITESKRAEEELRKERDFAKSMFETAQVIMLVLDTQGRIVDFNPFMEAISGYKVEEVRGRDWFSTFIPDKDRQPVREIFLKAVQGIQTRGNVNPIVTKSGNERQIEWYDKTLKDTIGNTIGLLAIGQDITERKLGEARLQEERNLLRTLIDHIPDVVFVKDIDSRFIICNKTVTEYWEAQGKGNIIGKTDFDLFEHKKAKKFFDEEQNLMQTGRLIINQEEQIIDKTGNVFYGLTAKVPLRDSRGNITGLVGINREITERKKAEQKLLEYQKRLKRLASQLALTEERERRRIAGELHDNVSQSLALAKIKLDALRASITYQPLADTLKETCDSLEKAIQNTRTLTFDLSNPILYELGFEEAVAEWFREQVQEKHGIAAEFQDDDLNKPLDDDVRVILFRNVRELLVNVIKHANAGKVRVRIRRTDESIEVTVEDNGVGFYTAEVGSLLGKRTQFGLFSIRESLEELGGRLEIESKPGAGCKAVMTAPLKGQPRKKEE